MRIKARSFDVLNGLSNDEFINQVEAAILVQKSREFISIAQKKGLPFQRRPSMMIAIKKGDMLLYMINKRMQLRKKPGPKTSPSNDSIDRGPPILGNDFPSRLTIKVPEEELWKFVSGGKKVLEAANHFKLNPRLVRRTIERMEVMKDQLLITKI